MILYVCEDCHTFSPNDPHAKHEGHAVIAMDGNDYEDCSRAAAAHIVLAQMIKTGLAMDGSVMAAMIQARAQADWFSEEDAIYDGPTWARDYSDDDVYGPVVTREKTGPEGPA